MRPEIELDGIRRIRVVGTEHTSQWPDAAKKAVRNLALADPLEAHHQSLSLAGEITFASTLQAPVHERGQSAGQKLMGFVSEITHLGSRT